MSPLRVGLSTTTVEPVLTHGRFDGIGVYTNALMHNLPEAGCAVDGYAFPPVRKPALARRFFGCAMPGSYPILSMQDMFVPGAMRRRMPVDVFHATDYLIVHMNCPVVATLHDAITQKHPEWCSPRLRGLKNWLQRKAARKADHVIALSKFTVPELVKYFGADERRITVVPCGVGDEWHETPARSDVDETLRTYGLERGYFLFVGTLQPRKNVERIIDAYLGLPEALRRERQLVIVGRPGWRCEELIKKIRATTERGEKLVWLNNLSDQNRLRHIYAGAGVFVFPSLYEGFGIPVAEAFASGVPVVTSNTTSLPEVSQGAALEVDPLSVSEIGAAMLDLVRNETLRERCIAAGRQRVSELTWSRTAAETAVVYRSVLSRG